MMGKRAQTDRKWNLHLLFSVVLFSRTWSVDSIYETSPELKKENTGVNLPSTKDSGATMSAFPFRLTHYFESDEADSPPENPAGSDVSLTCAGSDFVLRVKAGFYGLDADASELKLGRTCQSNVPGASGVHLFRYPLTACDGELEILPGYLVYKFVLHYDPSPERFPKAHPVTVNIECRYPRNYHMHRLAIQPTWETHILHKSLKTSQSDFRIQLMDDTWENPVQFRVFQLGEMVNFQVSALHLPPGQKLYISSCYASPVTQSKSPIKFTIIDNNGCLVDSRTDPGASKFISRTDEKVKFSMKAFQFVTDPDAEISMHCQLYVTTTGSRPAHKSCTYTLTGWEALSGDDAVCACCDSVCVSSKQHRAVMDGRSQSASGISSGTLWVTSHPDISKSTVNTDDVGKMHKPTDKAVKPRQVNFGNTDDVIVNVNHKKEMHQVKDSKGTKEEIKWSTEENYKVKDVESKGDILDFKQQNYTVQVTEYQRLKSDPALKEDVTKTDTDGEKLSKKPADFNEKAEIKEVFEWKNKNDDSNDDDDDELDGRKTWYFAWR